MSALTIEPGQFMARKPEFDGWAMAQFIRVGRPYSATMRDLFYCTSYRMLEDGGTWAWGRTNEFAMQIGIAGLEQYYTPVEEVEAATMAQDQLLRAQHAWNAMYPKHAHGIVIQEFGKPRPEDFTPTKLTTACRAR